MADAIRLAIVDKYPLYRDGVVHALRGHNNIVVVAEGATAKEAQQFANTKQINMLLLEAAVTGSLRVIQTILRTHPTVKVVFLASIEDEDHATKALRAGVHGYIMKGITGGELVKAIKTVHAGERYITSELAWRLVVQQAALPGVRAAALNFREKQVLEHTSTGQTAQEIASVLGLTISTVKHYKGLAYRKMGVQNRMQAIAAYRAGKQN